MGRKQNAAQRTKGNLQPSSSARAAELLVASGNVTTGGFLGFGLLKSAAQELDEVESNFDSDFALVLKKTTKRDSVTKLKALQEFSRLCQEKDADAVSSVLQYWPKVFSKMTNDCDSRVREAANEAFEQLVLRVRRNLAPHLKYVMGPWLVAQCDVYAPAASAAKSAFNSAFSPEKQSDAVGFCKHETLAHIEDMLLKQNSIDPKGQAPDQDEVATRQLQLLGSALEAWSLFIVTLTSKELETLHDGFAKILKDSKFWKFGKHSAGLVRSGFFHVIASLWEVYPQLAMEFADHICPAVLYSLDERDPSVVHALWLAILHTISIVPDWSSKVNAKKGLYPKLWLMLKNGAFGCALLSYPNLLPFLSFLPLSSSDDKLWFYDRFFCEMKAGLALQNVQQSPSEMNAVVKAFVECIRFCIKQDLASANPDQKFLRFLIMEQIVLLVEASFTDTTAALSRSRLYEDVVGLLAFIQQTTGWDKQEKTENEALAVVLFDELMLLLSEKILQNLDGGSGESLARSASFLEKCSPHLKQKDILDKKQKKSVKFASEELEDNTQEKDLNPINSKPLQEKSNLLDSRVDSVDCKAEPSRESSIDCDVDKLESQNEAKEKHDSSSKADSKDSSNKRLLVMQPNKVLSELVNKACLKSLMRAKEASDPNHLAVFSRSFAAFGSKELVSVLLRDFHPNLKDTATDPTVLFIKEILLPWMMEINQNLTAANGSQLIDLLVEITVMTWGLLDATMKTKQLSELIQNFDCCDLLCQLLQRLLASNHDAAVSQWLKNAEFGEFVVSLVRDLCQQGSKFSCDATSNRSKKWGLLCLVLSVDKHGEPVINKGHLDCVLGIVHSELLSRLESRDDFIDKYVNFACDVSYQFLTNIQELMAFPCGLKILLSIFQLSLKPTFLSNDVIEKLHVTWQQGIRTVLAQTGVKLAEDSFFNQIMNCLKDAIYGEAETVTALKHLAGVALRIRSVVLEAFDDPAAQDFLVERLCCAFHSSGITSYKNVLVVGRDMMFCSSDLMKAVPTSFVVVPKCIAPVAFTSLVMIEISKWSEKPETPEHSCESKDEADGVTEELAIQDTDGVDSTGLTICSLAKDEPEFLVRDCNMLVDMAEGLAFCQTVTRNRFHAHASSELCLVTSLLDENYTKLTSCLPQGALRRIMSVSLGRSMKEGGLSCLGLQVLLLRLREMRSEWDYFGEVEGLDQFIPLTPSLVATLQVLLPFFEAENVFQFAEFQVAHMMSCLHDDISEFVESMLLHLTVFNAAFSLQDCDSTQKTPFTELFLSVFTQIHDWRECHESLFLFDSTVSAEDRTVVLFNIEVMHFFALTITKHPTVLDGSQWDTILCSTISWMQSIAETWHHLLDSILMLAFTSAVCELLQALSVCLQSVVGSEQLGHVPPNLLLEWKDLFCPSAYGILVPLFIEVSEKLAQLDITTEVETMLSSLCSVVVHCPRELVLEHKLSTRLVAGEESNLPDSLQTLLNYCCPLLASRHRCIQLAVYRLLFKVIPELPIYDDKTTAPDGASSDAECSHCPPRPLVTVIEIGDLGIRSVLDDVDFGETVILNPFESEFSLAMAYLLGWNLLLEFFRTAKSELRVQYAQWLSEHSFVNPLMQSVFHLMPHNPVIMLKDSLISNGASKKLTSTRNMFSDDPSFEMRIVKSSQLTIHLQHIACCVYRRSLETLPALVRQWWMEQDKRDSGIVEKFTAKHVSPLLCARELRVIQETSGSLVSLTIKARPATREVIATYTVEECNMELVITLPANMPFSAISVESVNRVGVAKPQWRNWMLQLTVFLGFQNGSILDALSLWKRNVDKRFEGVDDCMICFSVIHGTNYQLPKLQCRTCKKRFHSTCLYKWFKTSNNATCPLCRNLF